MTYRLEYSKKFIKSLSKFDKQTSKQIIQSIDKFLNDFESANVKKLKTYENTYRIRSGDYRIIFEKYDETLVIIFIDVKHRKEVYRDL